MSDGSQHVTKLVGGRCRLDSLLGQGAMGAVWAAHDEVLDREVAMKEVLRLRRPSPRRSGRRSCARTLREGRAAARVGHHGSITVYDVVEDDERALARPAASWSRARWPTSSPPRAPLHPARAAAIGLQVLEGLASRARRGRPTPRRQAGQRPVRADGGAVLADFGMATLEDDAGSRSTGLVLGSPAYLAPERARGEVPTPAADLWSLGATLFAAVEGRSPFHREGPLPTLGALLTQDVPDAPAAGPLAPAIAALLTKDPAARPDAEAARRPPARRADRSGSRD